MSKIICDVCGTSYPETSTQCPICGCVRPADTVTVTADGNQTEAPSGTYTYVKGGRFSKANVKKRNSANLNTENSGDEDYHGDDMPQEKTGSDKGLVIAICVLLLAIIAVVIYIALHFFGPGQKGDNTIIVPPTTAATQPDITTEPTVIEIPCVSVVTSDTVIELSSVGADQLLNVTLDPVDTTEDLIFESSDSSVASVTESGKVVAVAPGEAVIYITCGNAVAECSVICSFEVESTEPVTDDAVENDSNVDPDSDPDTNVDVPGTSEYDPQSLTLNYRYTITIAGTEMGDITLNIGSVWTLYKDGEGKIPSSEISFTSSNPEICAVDKYGNIKAVSAGQAYITAEYMGHKVKCRIICR